jgi:hypothetical protein
MMGFAVAFVTALVTGAIQLGTVQTHVVINTDRLSLIEAREREHLRELATLKAHDEAMESRIRRLEGLRP